MRLIPHILAPLVLALLAASTAAGTDIRTQAAALLDQEHYLEAYELLYEAVERRPGDAATDLLLARAAFGAGDYEAAVMAAERVLMFNQGHVSARLVMAKALYRLGSVIQAGSQFDWLLASPDTSEETRADIRRFLASGGVR